MVIVADYLADTWRRNNMLALRIIATIFVGLSCITTIVKTVEAIDVDDHPGAALLFIV